MNVTIYIVCFICVYQTKFWEIYFTIGVIVKKIENYFKISNFYLTTYLFKENTKLFEGDGTIVIYVRKSKGSSIICKPLIDLYMNLLQQFLNPLLLKRLISFWRDLTWPNHCLIQILWTVCLTGSIFHFGIMHINHILKSLKDKRVGIFRFL